LNAFKAADLQGLSRGALTDIATALLAQMQTQQSAIDAKDEYIARRDREINFKDAKIERITFELARLEAWKFGTRTEAMSAEQRELFEDTLAEDEADLQAQLAALQTEAEQHTRPLWDELQAWMKLERSRVPDGDGIAAAPDDSLERWGALGRFIGDGVVSVDNTRIENLIRPWALGSKDRRRRSRRGAQRACLSARPFTKEAMKAFTAPSMGLPLTVVSDGLGFFAVAASMGVLHDREITGGGKASVLNEKFCAVNTLIGNVKKALTGRCHAIKCAKRQVRLPRPRRGPVPLQPALRHARDGRQLAASAGRNAKAAGGGNTG
jgi:Transposase IS66 family/Transposase C of IS166 homeodomain